MPTPRLPRVSSRHACSALLALVLALPSSVVAQRAGAGGATSPDATQRLIDALDLREIGPAVMGGRVAGLAVNEADPSEFYVGTATGGLWKTTSQGMRWEEVFVSRGMPTSSIGAVALAPSNPNVVWVGTGEPQNRQSSPYGAGVFRSVDGGRTWRALGLEETRHIGRIVVHPRDPDVAYVAAVGHLFGPNEERGVYKTTDGGASWSKVLYLDERTGAIDLAMDPGDPNTVFAAMYRRQRTPWGFAAGSERGGIYRTLDGGATWQRLEQGLPEGPIGRVGLDVYRRDGNLVYAVVEAAREGRGVYRSDDRGASWRKVSDNNPRPMYFSHIRVDPNDPERIWMGGVSLQMSDDGGKTWKDGDAAEGIHVDHHAIWIDPSNSEHVILGNDGGVAATFDRGESWRHYDNIALGQFYQIGVDMRDPYYVCGGLQDNSSWCGPSESLTPYGIKNWDWYDVSGGDGFYNKIPPGDPSVVFTESQGGNISRYHIETGEQQRIRAVARPTPEDSAREYRFNWNAPIHISWHDENTIYHGANHLLRSRDRGVTWEEASPDLTRRIDRDTLLIMGDSVTDATLSRHDGVSDYGTITAFGESPLDAGVLYVGTDDGKLSVSRDGGATWTDITRHVEGLGHGMVVSSIEPSRHQAGRVYLAFDGHYSDDYAAYLYVSEDYGRSWRRITAGLPHESVNVIREHPRTPGLLFVGNEVGVFVSFDRGGSWRRLTGDLPIVPVDDLVLHPRENDLVIGTHGRSIWILDDVAPLEELARDASLLAADAHLFPAQQATQWFETGAGWPFWGDTFTGEDAEDGAVLRYWLGAGGAADSVRLVIRDADGATVRTIEAPGAAGYHEVAWDLRMDDPYEAASEEPTSWRNRPPRGPLVLPGTYRVRLDAASARLADDDGVAVPAATLERELVVRMDPRADADPAALRARFDALHELHRLARPVYDAQQAAEKAGARAEAVQDLLERADADSTLIAEADAVAEQADSLRDRIGELRRGGFLAFSLESIAAAPTADQQWEIAEAWRKAPGVARDLNALLDRLAALEAKVYTEAARPPRIEAVQVPARD